MAADSAWDQEINSLRLELAKAKQERQDDNKAACQAIVNDVTSRLAALKVTLDAAGDTSLI